MGRPVRRQQPGRLPAVTAPDQADVMEEAPALAREQELGGLPRVPRPPGPGTAAIPFSTACGSPQ